MRKRNLLSRFSEERLGGYNLIVDHTPTCLTAKVLPSPVIKFEQSEARVKDGSFNLHNMRFSR